MVLYLRRSRYTYPEYRETSVQTYSMRGRIFKTEERSGSTSGARRNPLQSATSSSSLSNISAEQLESILLPKSGLASLLSCDSVRHISYQHLFHLRLCYILIYVHTRIYIHIYIILFPNVNYAVLLPVINIAVIFVYLFYLESFDIYLLKAILAIKRRFDWK